MKKVRFNAVQNVPPSSATLLGAMRGMGYSPGAAVADIVDNSISAGAGTVWIDFHWAEGDCWISILDDGCGMSPDELCRAMRLGSAPVDAPRRASDLGRFGLGLKTASFSQCRRLTVATLRNEEMSCLRWDLDELAKADGAWNLLAGPAQGSEERLGELSSLSHGTLVLWEKLDRLLPVEDAGLFMDVMDEVEAHLALTFGMLIAGSGLKMLLNGRRVKPRDPFLSAHSGTIVLPVAYAGAVTVQGFILPGRDRLGDEEYEAAGRPGGWTAMQGFYIYRNRRLILAGSWLGLPRLSRDPFCNQARIRLDIPCSLDSEWKTDIRKASARPPAPLRDELVRIAQNVRSRARRIALGHRSSRPSRDDFDIFQLWIMERTARGIVRGINMEHPWIRELLAEAGEPLGKKFRKLLGVIGQMVPDSPEVEALREKTNIREDASCGEPSAEMKELMQTVLDMYVEQGMSVAQARNVMLHMEKFGRWRHFVENLEERGNE